MTGQRIRLRWDRGRGQWICWRMDTWRRVAAFDTEAEARHWIAGEGAEAVNNTGENTRTRVLLALLFVYRCDGRATVRTVSEAARRPFTTTYEALLSLRDEGLIAWEDGRSGTLRPLVGAVA